MYPSRVTGYQDPLSWIFSKVLLTPIYELVILYQPCSTGSDLHQAPHVCVIPWVSSELVQGLLSFAHMILPIMCLHLQWLQMSLRSLCLVSHDVSIYCMMELWTSLHVSIMHPRHHSSWTGLPFLLGYFFIVGRFFINVVTAFIIFILHLELSSLVLWNKSYPSLLVGDYVRDLSYKSNAFVWLERFHKEYSYWKVIMHKYMIMKLLYPIQHSSISR